MSGRYAFDKAAGLVRKYPEIFGRNIVLAQSYIMMVECLNEIDKEFQQTNHVGKVHTQFLLNFLKNNIQFRSKENLHLTLEDIVRLLEVCKKAQIPRIQGFVDEALKEAYKLEEHFDPLFIEGFDFVNLRALKELNERLFEESKQKKEGITEKHQTKPQDVKLKMEGKAGESLKENTPPNFKKR